MNCFKYKISRYIVAWDEKLSFFMIEIYNQRFIGKRMFCVEQGKEVRGKSCAKKGQRNLGFKVSPGYMSSVQYSLLNDRFIYQNAVILSVAVI